MAAPNFSTALSRPVRLSGEKKMIPWASGTKARLPPPLMIKAILGGGEKVGMIGTNGTAIGDRVTP